MSTYKRTNRHQLILEKRDEYNNFNDSLLASSRATPSGDVYFLRPADYYVSVYFGQTPKSYWSLGNTRSYDRTDRGSIWPYQ